MSITTSTSISVEEYLRTSFDDGDREYVDGRLVERNVGDIDHSDLQGSIVTHLRTHYSEIWVGPQVRVQVRPTRFRVPDVTVVTGGKPKGRVIVSPPLIVVEVLSPDDRADELQEKINDYLEFGVRYVWVIDPRTRRAYAYTSSGIHEAKDGMLRTENPNLELPLASLF